MLSVSMTIDQQHFDFMKIYSYGKRLWQQQPLLDASSFPLVRLSRVVWHAEIHLQGSFRTIIL